MSEAQLSRSGQRGRLRIVLGVVCILLGLAAILWPGATLLVVAFLFGLELITAGMVRIGSAVTLKTLPGWWRGLSAVLGALTLVAGLICLLRPGASLLTLLVVIAVGWIVDGLSELVSAFAVSRGARERVGLVAFGLLSIVAAIVLLTLPGTSLILLARLGGAVLIGFGIASMIAASTRTRQLSGVGTAAATP